MGGAGSPPRMDIIKSGAYFIKSGAQYNERVFLLGNKSETLSHGFLRHAIFTYLLAYELKNTSNAK